MKEESPKQMQVAQGDRQDGKMGELTHSQLQEENWNVLSAKEIIRLLRVRPGKQRL